MSLAQAHPHNAPGAHPPPQLSLKAIAGLSGIFIAAMMAGLNNRVGALGLADIRGALGFGLDDASWITTAYTVGELVATPLRHLVRHHAIGQTFSSADGNDLCGDCRHSAFCAQPEPPDIFALPARDEQWCIDSDPDDGGTEVPSPSVSVTWFGALCDDRHFCPKRRHLAYRPMDR